DKAQGPEAAAAPSATFVTLIAGLAPIVRTVAATNHRRIDRHLVDRFHRPRRNLQNLRLVGDRSHGLAQRVREGRFHYGDLSGLHWLNRVRNLSRANGTRRQNVEWIERHRRESRV